MLNVASFFPPMMMVPRCASFLADTIFTVPALQSCCYYGECSVSVSFLKLKQLGGCAVDSLHAAVVKQVRNPISSICPVVETVFLLTPSPSFIMWFKLIYTRLKIEMNG
ncbi:hypothetical protein MKW98_025695 [Papaver atlanticum]|uniref:Uncharacterized protein n=1 Tax=Papaver atlanticum TaxID=357466 RepID=A0AAD4XBC6_9MAGN|nr:hypothetical protein MKW98_025695 [Papaver atlanticum]